MKTLPSKAILTVFLLGFFLQLAWYALLMGQIAGSGDFLKDIDFRIIYTAGQIAREGSWNTVYDLEQQLETQRQITGRPLEMADVLPFNHPPVLLPLQWLVSLAEYRVAYLLWGGLVALVSLLNALLVFRLTQRMGWPGLPAAFLAIQSFLFYPIFVSLNKGQDTIFGLIGLTILLLGLQENREKLSGLGLAVLTLRPQLALPLALPFLFRQRKIWWWFVGIALVLVVYSVLMVGLEGVTDFINLLVLTSSGEAVLIHHADMYNLKGLLMRLFPAIEMDVVSGLSWVVFILVMAFLCWLWTHAQKVEFYHISLAVTLGLFASPHLHYHDISFLFISTLSLLLALTAKGILGPWQAALLLLAESFYLAIIHITPANHWGVYLLMLGLVILSGIAGRMSVTQPSARFS